MRARRLPLLSQIVLADDDEHGAYDSYAMSNEPSVLLFSADDGHEDPSAAPHPTFGDLAVRRC